MSRCPKCSGDGKCYNDEYDNEETSCELCGGLGTVPRSVHNDVWCMCCCRHYVTCTCSEKPWVGSERYIEVISSYHGLSEEEVREELERMREELLDEEDYWDNFSEDDSDDDEDGESEEEELEDEEDEEDCDDEAEENEDDWEDDD